MLSMSSAMPMSTIQIYSAPNSQPGSQLPTLQRCNETEGSDAHQEQGFHDRNNHQVKLQLE